MTDSLIRLLEEKGDVAFPHAPETGEMLLELFRAGRDAQSTMAASLTDLVRADPGFAFNVARLLSENGMPFNSRSPLGIRESLERGNAFRAVAILAPLDTWDDAFRAYPSVRSAYAEISVAAAGAAQQVLRVPGVEERERGLAVLLVFGTVFGILGLANLLPDHALTMVNAGAVLGDSCEETLGFSLAEFTTELGKRYAMPELADMASPAVRDLVRTALEIASEEQAARGRTGAAA